MSTVFLVRHGEPEGSGISTAGRAQARAAAIEILAACARETIEHESQRKPVGIHSSPTDRARATSAVIHATCVEDGTHSVPDILIADVLDLPDTRSDSLRMLETLRALLADEERGHICVTHEPNVVIAAREFGLPIREIRWGGVVRIGIPAHGAEPVATILTP
ncbi:hypothetical protein HY480_00320 [Candidatus Uhrbacteria bacterium]|nr:hypothetical protein [Candidatus Uhrbacteria bacterium]